MKKNLIVSIIALAILSILIVAGVRQSRYQAENIVEGRVWHIYGSSLRPTDFLFLPDGTEDFPGDMWICRYHSTYLLDADDPTGTVTISAIIYDERGRVTTPGAIRPMQHVQIGYDVRPIITYSGKISESEVVRFVRILESKCTLNEIYMFYAQDYLDRADAISVENAELLTPAQKKELIRLCEDTAGKTLPLVTYREVNGKKGYYDENGQLYDGGKGKLIFSGKIDEYGDRRADVTLYYAPLGAYGHYIYLHNEGPGRWSVISESSWIS